MPLDGRFPKYILRQEGGIPSNAEQGYIDIAYFELSLKDKKAFPVRANREK